MKIRVLILIVAFWTTPLLAQNKSYSSIQYQEDFNYFWKTINDEYCYFDKKQTDWNRVKMLYAPMIDTVKSRNSFVAVMEKAFYELYDHHCNFNTNTNASRRLVPTGTDVWAEYEGGKPIITEVRKSFGADACGITAGMETISINDIPIDSAIQSFLPVALKKADVEANNFALRLALAGNHTQQRKFTLKYKGQLSDYFPDPGELQLDHVSYKGRLESRMYGNVGYIRINNCLFDNELIPAFDSVMNNMKLSSALIIDLRETPSGGNSSVARAILGWFVSEDKFYQKHEYYAEEKMLGIKRSWEEIVSPRKNKFYGKPLAVLVDHWTGSIAEGIAIGFDALHRLNTKIIGTSMAGLNGAVYSYEMPNTKINFSFTAERLFHINGLPREKYQPQILINVSRVKNVAEPDIFITAAIRFLKGR